MSVAQALRIGAMSSMAASLLVLAGCTARITATDSGSIVPPDPDTGASDTGPRPDDTGTTDTGTTDAGTTDAGSHDAGTDAGPHDAGTDAARYDAGGRCAGVDCSRSTRGCMMGVCNPATGACTAVPIPSGDPCDDGNLCTTGDTCMGTTCVGTATDCSGLTNICGTGVCDPTSGLCNVNPVTNGTSCGATVDACNGHICQAGTCVVGPINEAMVCDAAPDACHVRTCVSGTCTTGNAADGTVCGTTSTSCVANVCAAGTCAMAPAGDCFSCGAGLYCSGGSCGAAPSVLTYDFEAGVFPANWMNGAGGRTPWTITTSSVHGGMNSARAGVITDYGESGVQMSVTVASASTLTFWYSVSSESCCDYLEYYIDGTFVNSWAGTIAWTSATAPLPAGTHTIEWRYTKDGSLSRGSDTAWIDDITITPTTAGAPLCGP
jgi:hypothetical protein